jgi:hypothetical protein
VYRLASAALSSLEPGSAKRFSRGCGTISLKAERWFNEWDLRGMRRPLKPSTNGIGSGRALRNGYLRQPRDRFGGDHGYRFGLAVAEMLYTRVLGTRAI